MGFARSPVASIPIPHLRVSPCLSLSQPDLSKDIPGSPLLLFSLPLLFASLSSSLSRARALFIEGSTISSSRTYTHIYTQWKREALENTSYTYRSTRASAAITRLFTTHMCIFISTSPDWCAPRVVYDLSNRLSSTVFLLLFFIYNSSFLRVASFALFRVTFYLGLFEFYYVVTLNVKTFR